ncbi:MAG TPA: hypothetical protein VGR19_06855 [Allosphingosinicella sp.]|nr:hypothetical protein [Allosphingosinicella sp.]
MRFDKKALGAVAVGAAAIAATVAVVMMRPSAPAPKASAEEAARQEVEAIYREARAVAEAEAKAKEELRQAELNAAEETLNLIDADQEPPPALVEGEDVMETIGNGSNPAGQGERLQGTRDVLSRDLYTKGESGKEAPEAPEEPQR